MTFDDLTLNEIMDLDSGWHPPENEADWFIVEHGFVRWQSWDDFDECYAAVRDDFLAWHETKKLSDDDVPFAERRYLQQHYQDTDEDDPRITYLRAIKAKGETGSF